MLELRQLTKIYPGPVAAVRDVDLDVPVGMFGLLGPNGAGKTTLMRIVAGLLEPTSGRVLLGGDDLTVDPKRVWDRLGYLPQEFGFYPHLTGRKMLTYLLRLKGVAPPQGRLADLVDELLTRVNLQEAADRKVDSYSGGMRQRLGIAQAIAGDPELIIVDEPTAGLDPEERLRFYRLLAELAVDRIVLLSTHIVEDVAVLCPRFAILRQGRVIADTSPAAARQALHGHIYRATVPREAVAQIEATHRVTQSVLVEGRHQLRVYAPDGAAPTGFEPVSPSLEDAYLLAINDHQRTAAGVADRPAVAAGAAS